MKTATKKPATATKKPATATKKPAKTATKKPAKTATRPATTAGVDARTVTLRLADVRIIADANSRGGEIVAVAKLAREKHAQWVTAGLEALATKGVLDHETNRQGLMQVLFDLSDLLLTIPSVGLQQLPSVVPHGPKLEEYALHVGSRRFAALWLLYGPEHRQTFMVATTGGDRALGNLVENIARKGLTSHDEAKRLAAAKGKYSTRDLSVRTGRSISHIDNLARAYTNLVPPLRDEWQSMGHAAPLRLLISLSSLPQKAQMKAWRDHVTRAKATPQPPQQSYRMPPAYARETRIKLLAIESTLNPEWLEHGGRQWLAGANAALTSVLEAGELGIPREAYGQMALEFQEAEDATKGEEAAE